MSRCQVHALFDPVTYTLTYVVWDAVSRDAVILDPVLDYDPTTRMVSTQSLAQLLKFIDLQKLRVHWVLETHAHADHLSPAQGMRELGMAEQWGLSGRMREVFETFKKVFAWPGPFRMPVDRFFADGEEFTAGTLRLQALATPGHTPACMTFRVGEWLFTGDALFMPDSGVGRCDFPGGSASTLYDSVWGKIYAFPDHFEIFVGHDYQPGGRPLRYRTTVGAEKSCNIHLNGATSREAFVAFREGRDKSLAAPRLLNVSLDWNLSAFELTPRTAWNA